jgi:hypothetical protein
MNPLVLLLPILMIASWARIVRPGQAVEGRTVLVVRMPLLARLRMQAAPIVLTLTVGLALAVGNAMPWAALLAPILSSVLLVVVPVRYHLTDLGIRRGWTGFRRWTEFAGVRRAPGGARLLGVQRSRGMHVWLSDSRGDDEFLQYLRETVRDAYKGRRVMAFPTSARPSGSGGDAPPESMSSVAAFSGDGTTGHDLP